MDPLTFKLLLSAAIFLAGWAGGWIPIASSTRPEGSSFTSWGNAFAAGIFLGTGLIHLLGEADRTWRLLGWDYPMALLLAAAGFMAILLFEHVLLPPSAHEVTHAHSGEALGEETVRRLRSGTTPYALLLALSVHSVIAGIALGGQTSFAGAFYIFVAIMAHKSTAAFALGVALARAALPRRRAHALVVLFAAMTPLGILAGAALSNLLRTLGGQYFDATFLALAAGTFVYIASMDILQDEFLHAGGRLVKWLFAAAAIALTALLSIWI